VLKVVLRELFGCALVGALFAHMACTSITGSSSSSAFVTTFAPTTGIEVDANSLFERLGCGPSVGVPFKYVVTVNQTLPGLPAVAISVNDCFADAVFLNLGAAIGASGNYALTIDVFDDASYNANVALLGNPVVGDAAAIDAIAKWRASCTVLEEPDVQSIAACDPLIATGN
jgi:hypothetical protein